MITSLETGSREREERLQAKESGEDFEGEDTISRVVERMEKARRDVAINVNESVLERTSRGAFFVRCRRTYLFVKEELNACIRVVPANTLVDRGKAGRKKGLEVLDILPQGPICATKIKIV